ncbi:hypothetical protein EDB82DRAFT_521915 [Fusarium venenatum]|uniref:uncharacterized protein n=1 Tax=Fusarium venenatum TaxID=56646 RepID=UPI001D69C2E2|nr:hypothetical protein EDB82DRAFT_521915 [Fusarium venenatum]
MAQFDWFSSIGATDEAVAVLNDQPILFTILLVVLVAPEQRKAAQDKKDKKKAAKTKKPANAR